MSGVGGDRTGSPVTHSRFTHEVDTQRSGSNCTDFRYRGSCRQLKPEQRMMCPRRHGIGQRRTPILRPEVLALQRTAAGGAVLYLLGISLARFYIVEEDPSVMPLGVPELRPQFVRLAARAIKRCPRLLPPRWVRSSYGGPIVTWITKTRGPRSIKTLLGVGAGPCQLPRITLPRLSEKSLAGSLGGSVWLVAMRVPK